MPTGLLFNKKDICAGFGEFKKKIMTVLLNEEKEQNQGYQKRLLFK